MTKKNDESEERNERILKLLSELSHSMRNPFATMQSYLNILEMEDYKYEPDALKELSGILSGTVEKSIKVIDEKIAALKAELGV